MAWQIKTNNGRSRRVDHWELAGSQINEAEEGWDTATYSFAVRGGVTLARSLFYRGRAHPTATGLFCTGMTISQAAWKGYLVLGQASYAGILGGVMGTIVRREVRGANMTSRTVTAEELGAEYGVSGRLVIRAPGGEVDAVRRYSLQPHSERQLVTNIPPPGVMSFDTLRQAAPLVEVDSIQALSWLGVNKIYNTPTGMLCSTVRYQQHSGGAPLWLVDIRWERIVAMEWT